MTVRVSSIKGQLSEIRVVADLLDRGFQVFSPVLGYPTRCDLVAVKGSQCWRIEVKTAHWELDGSRLVAGRPTADRAIFFDVLALATPTGVVYEPPFPEEVAQCA